VRIANGTRLDACDRNLFNGDATARDRFWSAAD
jgi:hypothetical protein